MKISASSNKKILDITYKKAASIKIKTKATLMFILNLPYTSKHCVIALKGISYLKLAYCIL